MTYADLQQALTVLGLRERSTLTEIKKRHRELVKHYHPDTGNSGDGGKVREVNSAYRMLMEYISSYQFSFTEQEFYEQNPEERIRQQFMDVAQWRR